MNRWPFVRGLLRRCARGPGLLWPAVRSPPGGQVPAPPTSGDSSTRGRRVPDPCPATALQPTGGDRRSRGCGGSPANGWTRLGGDAKYTLRPGGVS